VNSTAEQATAQAPAAGQAAASVPAEAIVFVAGLGDDEHAQGGHIAQLLAWELSQRAGDRTATFAVHPTSVATEAVQRIERTDAGGTTALLDVYTYSPKQALDAQSPSSAAVRRVVTLALTVLAGILIWCAAFVRSFIRHTSRAKSVPQMLQLILCLFVLFILGAYFLTAVYALLEAVIVALRGSNRSAPHISWPQWTVLAASVAGMLLPNLREWLTQSAEHYQQMMRYIWTASTRNQLTGQVQSLLDRVNERPEISRIHVVGFSFGSLIVLDTLFPAGNRPAPIQQIPSMVTIGCPFDLIRMLNPPYAESRMAASPTGMKWINIYQPIDVLASNFADGDDVAPIASTGLKLTDGTIRKPDLNLGWNVNTRLTPANFLMLTSVSTHGQYWDDNTVARTALGPVVDALYANTPALR
jgi:pimeloyl-ACP methyl ester carboxylesterase